MHDITLRKGQLSQAEQETVARGFSHHARAVSAPEYQKQHFNWTMRDDDQQVVAVLTADLLWDCLYVDELWVDERLRGQNHGRRLMAAMEAHGASLGVTGVWLWTQSWQAAEFYQRLGYEVFTEFPDFPKGYSRIGFRKYFGKNAP